jgi:hypothetical protein
MLRATLPYKPSEGAKRGKPLIPGDNGATSSVFQVREKIRNDIARKVVDHELINDCFALSGDKRQEQTEGIPIALLRVSGCPALMNQMLR